MDKAKILQFLDGVTDALKAAAPVATMLGIPLVEKLVGWADTAVEVGQNALTRAEEGKLVLSSDDKDLIASKIAALESENARLNAEIEAS